MELRRVLNAKNIIVILSAVFVNIVIFLFGITYGGNIKSTVSEAAEYKRAVEEYEKYGASEVIALIKSQKLAGTSNTYKKILDELNYIEGYKKEIQNIVKSADRLKTNRIFADKKSFSYKNIIKTGEDFGKLLDVNLTLDNNTAVEKISEYFQINVISLAVLLYIINSVYAERDNNMWQLSYSARKGRANMALARVGVFLLISFCTHGLLYFSTAATAFMIFGGLGKLGNPIQNLSSFSQCTLIINKAEYISVNFLCGYIAVLSMASVIYMLMTVFRNRKNVAIGVSVFAIAEYFLYVGIESQSVYRILKFLNVINLFKIGDIFTKYINVNFLSKAVNIRDLLTLLLIFFSVLMMSVSAAAYTKMKPYVKYGFITKIINQINSMYQKAFERVHGVVKEMHKIIFTSKGVWLSVFAVLCSVYFSTTGYVSFTDLEKQNDRLYAEHGGSDYSYIQNYVNSIMKKLSETEQKRDEAKKKYDIGEINFNEYYAALSDYSSAQSIAVSAAEPMQKLAYLKELKQNKGIDGYIMSDRGYEQIIGKYSVQREVIIFTVLELSVILITCGCVYIERKSGMRSLIKSSLGGYRLLHRNKIIAGVLIFLSLSIIVNAVEYINLFKYYGMPYLEAPLQSLSFMESVDLNISVGGFIALTAVFKTALTLAIFIGTYITSSMYARLFFMRQLM
jgi:hypothetical protein